MNFIRKIIGGLLYFTALICVLGAVGSIINDGESPAGRWSTVIFGLLMAALWAWLGKKAWPSSKTDAAMLAAVDSLTPRKEPSDRLSSSEITELESVSRKILADDLVTPSEARYLLRWLDRHPAAFDDARTFLLAMSVKDAFADDVFDDDEADEVRTLLGEFCDEVGEPVSSPQAPKPEGQASGLEALVSGGQYMMSYRDAEGKVTERAIRFNKQTGSGGTAYLQAFCLMRKANRTFRVDRIESLFSTDTGEILV